MIDFEANVFFDIQYYMIMQMKGDLENYTCTVKKGLKADGSGHGSAG